jgi:hypothetical protein
MRKWPILLMVLCLGLLGQDRQPNRRCVLRVIGHTVEISIETRDQFGPPKILKTVMKTNSALTISADEMMYNQDNGEIEPRGNVRVKLD